MPSDYQNFVPPHPRFPLATFPSQLERAERLERALRAEGGAPVPRIYLKRDDLLSLGMGGNKIRNLEFSIGQALAEGATDIVTAGRQQSNHCRLTAAACARAGLRAHLVLNGEPPSSATGNVLLDHLLGANVYYTGSDDRAARAAEIERLLSAGGLAAARQPYLIPVGGSDARGALGHVLAAREIIEQCSAIAETPAAVVLATATGGTQAGLLAGLSKLGTPPPVYGFAVAKSAPELVAEILTLANEVAMEIRIVTIPAGAVSVDDSALGDGYGVPTPEAQAAIELLARTEGVFADPTYTGKGLAGMLALIRSGAFANDQAVVFIHTGGTPALFT